MTPISAKAQALLAMLAVAPHGTRSREWLKSKLWSTRARDQAAGSLRQCLLQIRRSLGDAAQVIAADRHNVSIDLDRVEIRSAERGELLEGVPIFDDAFAVWLRQERLALPNSSREVLSSIACDIGHEPAQENRIDCHNRSRRTDDGVVCAIGG
ncbi:hypothetical protein QTO30_07820 [Yoonia sp. GPGPB17]|uniref:AfsR/SARP family transcriptional regulator n=1 Tax=Yoonia sp. GPGPB17 TaxID=3026147 RepID=UPI0030BD45CA